MSSPQGDVPLAPLRGPEPGLRKAVLLVVALLAIAVVKPWDRASVSGDHLVPQVAPTVAASVAPDAAARTSAPLRLAHSVLLTSASILRPGTAPAGDDVACYPSAGWRVVTVDGAGADRLRTWYNLVPGWGATATDPGIPVVHVFARDLVALGFCAPTGDGQALATAEVRGWRLDQARAMPIGLARLAASSPRDTALGSLYGSPPSAAAPSTDPGVAGTWPDGRYVFLIRAGQADEEDIWFGVDVTRMVDAPAGGAPPSGATVHASP